MLSQDYDELNVDEQIANIDPQLWNAMCCITRSKSEIRGTLKVIDPNSPAYHVKKVRQFFLLCAIMFSTDDREDLADVALEEAVHSNIHVNLDEEDADEFAEFVFAAAFDVGNETNVNAELIAE